MVTDDPQGLPTGVPAGPEAEVLEVPTADVPPARVDGGDHDTPGAPPAPRRIAYLHARGFAPVLVPALSAAQDETIFVIDPSWRARLTITNPRRGPMKQQFTAVNNLDENGCPAGGHVIMHGPLSSPMLSIRWQDGPLGRGAERLEPNGAFVETVIEAAAQRIQHYQESQFACAENAEALDHLDAALAALRSRTARREAAGVEGTLEGN